MENNCKCKTCKHLKGILKPNDRNIETSLICTANEECYIDITQMLNINLGQCLDYVSYDENITNENIYTELKEYDYHTDSKHIDCTNCGYFSTSTIQYPCGHCIIKKEDTACGLGFFCDKFVERGTAPKMDTKISSNIKDLQKLALQVDYLKNKEE